MDRKKFQMQVAKLRNKKTQVRIAPKIKKGVVKLKSFSTKNVPSAPSQAKNKIVPLKTKSTQSNALPRYKSTGGCGGCKRKIGRK